MNNELTAKDIRDMEEEIEYRKLVVRPKALEDVKTARAHGDLSGWVYTVNGISANVGCGSYYLKDGDVVEWLYTTDGIDRTGTYENP